MSDNQIPIFVINLDQSRDRLAAMHEGLSKLSLKYERFPAVYGRDVSLEYIKENYPQFETLYHKGLCAGAFGCTLSHIGVNQLILERGYSRACVLEDDVQFDDDFPSFLDPSLVIPLEAEALKLESSLKRKWIWATKINSIGNRDFVFMPAHGANGSGAYIITNGGARKFVENIPKFPFGSLDHIAFNYETSKIKICHVLPYPARQHGKSVIKSDLSRKKAKEEIRSPIRIIAKRYAKFMEVAEKFRASKGLIGRRIYNIRIFKTQTAPVSRW